MIFFIFFSKNTPNIISKLNDDFSEDFFEVLHIFVGQKIKILENRLDFLTYYQNKNIQSSNPELVHNNQIHQTHS